MKYFSQILGGILLIACCLLLPHTRAWANNIMIGGYWENWNNALHPGSESTSEAAYYANDFAPFTLVYYSFLTLAKSPNPDNPPNQQWDGESIYESMTAADVIDVMTPTVPEWENPNNWQRLKIQAMIDSCHADGKKFIWAIGGWSDLTRTISDDQIQAFVDYCVKLLSLTGDGIDFDWEHLSENSDIKDQQRHVLGKIFPVLRKALDENGLHDKLIGYTTRLNAFWDDSTRPSSVIQFNTDGEGIDVVQALVDAGSSLDNTVDWVNVMMYDAPPEDLGAQGAFSLANYAMVLGFFRQYVSQSKIVMGFEPGGQMAGGVWEGMDVDKQVIDYIKTNNYGGVMFWAINQPAMPPSTEVTGDNAQALAAYAAQDSSTSITPIVMLLVLQ
ncbi:glycoside hydrolase family 18 protein [Desulfovibrio inopinatus]|uniref:glycoside hydrolase family 18 protein n=1 Tax=Desulfovibrio inopinatus TaxID=102109 RepID=UPI0004186441|nr:glycoside hydrolase family 18 protein [Desulfovibrio inopinatus]